MPGTSVKRDPFLRLFCGNGSLNYKILVLCPTNNVAKVVMTMVSGVSVQVSIPGFKGSTFKGFEVR